MIYTITFNPALDYITQVDNFEIGKVNRTITEKILNIDWNKTKDIEKIWTK